ncbi:autotransporter-associated N-terminal domain-containing protein [Fusobacterium polymorphum]|uniref:autotransporter-associated N-terminal domain-containing protein n=3 Tax=Fusobacterium nucleatum subsp. polymorphum TaxID=76857 RepID=UPI000BFDE92B|nr:autotransporter-associated N-terminal domain-containing protein [Fusobacterium polymorphum]PHI04976.1 hypothetical protein CA845_08185 [Fusobacterium polymorphum]
MVNNNLYKVENTLRSIAKRYKSVKYSLGLAILFLMMGVSAFSEEVVAQEAVAQQEVMTTEQIASSKDNLKDSIGGLKSKIDTARAENEKSLAGLRLELIQLMEQGNQVVKSPWSSWQFGANYMYDKWNGAYKGRGDKAEKYPYEGILTRSDNVYERNISPLSKRYSSLPTSSNFGSASSNNRNGIPNGYGLVRVKEVQEPIVGFDVSAGVRPKQVVKGAINIADKNPITPEKPEAISFNAPVINVIPPAAPTINAVVPTVTVPTVTPPTVTEPDLPPTISFTVSSPNITVPTLTAPNVTIPSVPGTGNGDGTWIQKNGSVGAFHQVNVDGGKIDVNVSGSSFDMHITGSKLIGESGPHTLSYYNNIVGPPTNATSVTTSGSSASPLTFSLLGNTSPYAAMKLVGGQEINIDNVNINLSGTGPTNYQKWLFHTDGHDDYGDSTWVTNGATNITINGTNLVMYTSQYHGGTSQNAAIGFVNDGTITTTASTTDTANFIWYAMADGGNINRVMYFHNRNGNITLNGTKDIFAILNSEDGNGGFSVINDNKLEIAGEKNTGITFGRDYTRSEILLNKAMTLTGNNGTGIYFNKNVDLDGGASRKVSSADNIVTSFTPTTRESILNIDITNGTGNSGLFFDLNGATYNVANSTINLSSPVGSNAGIFVQNGTVNITNSGKNNVNLTGGKDNVGIYVDTSSAAGSKAAILNAAGDVNIKGGTGGIGILSVGNSATGVTASNKGKVTVSASDNTGMVAAAKGSIGGEINQDGTVLVNTKNAIGVAAVGNGAKAYINNKSTTTAGETTGKAGSAAGASGLYAADNGQVLSLSGATINSANGGVGAYASGATNGGTIDFNGSTINTNIRGLSFMADGKGVINFSGTTTGNIADYGTVFYVAPVNTPSSVTDTANFNSTASIVPSFTSMVQAHFSNLGNLNLNMTNKSNMIVTSYVLGNASDLAFNETTAFGTAGTPNITGDYKAFLLDKSIIEVDVDSDLDSTSSGTAAAFRKLALASSTITNNKAITGTESGLIAMAQEDITTGGWVNLKNSTGATINLSGDKSVAMYASNGKITNDGSITVGDKGVAIYGHNNGYGDTEISNTGKITVGSQSTGIYAKDYDTKDVKNSNTGIIEINGSQSSAMAFVPKNLTATTTVFENEGKILDNNSGSNNTGMFAKVAANNVLYTTKNSGTITLGDSSALSNPSVGMYTNASSTGTNPLINTGKISVGNSGIGMYGFEEDTTGDITAGNTGIGIYSQGGDVNIGSTGTTPKITVGDTNATAVFTTGSGQTITSTNADYNIGDNSYGFVNVGTGNTLNISGGSATLTDNGVFIYSNDTTGNITNSTKITSTGSKGYNYGVFSAGTVSNSGDITLTNGVGNVGVYAANNGNITNSGNITLGASTSADRSVGAIANVGTVNNTGKITVNGQYGIGAYSSGSGSTINNSGDITLTGDETIGAYGANGSNINLNSGTVALTGNKSTGYYLDAGTGSTIASGAKINVTGEEANGVYANTGSTLTYSGDTTVDGDAAYGLIVDGNSNVNATGGSLTIKGTSGVNGTSSGSTTNRGSAALVVTSGSNLTGGLDVTADVAGDNSVGVYSAGSLAMNSANISAYDSGVNFFTDGGTISVGNNGGTSTVVAGTGANKGSLLFYTPSGNILLNGPVNATVEGGTKAATRATAFYYTGGGTLGSLGTYTQLNPTNVATWARNSFGNGSTSTLGNLNLTMNQDSRLFLTEKVNMDLSNTSVSNLFSGLSASERPNITGAGSYRTFMLYHSHLNVDQAVDLDNANNEYNLMEISSSSITNNNTITGTKTGQIAMAQENDTTPKSVVTLANNGTINLSGLNSAGIYTKNGIINNTNAITVGNSSSGIYALNNTEISNTGSITTGGSSTGIYYSDVEKDNAGNITTVNNTTTGLANAGSITLNGDDSVGLTYEPGNITGSVTFENSSTGSITSTGDKNVGMFAKLAQNGVSYNTVNNGNITLGNSASMSNPNVAMYTNATSTGTNPLQNAGDITVGNNSVGMYGFEENSSGNITVGNGSIGLYSKNGNVDVSGSITTGSSNESVGVYTVGSGQTITSTGATFNLGDTSFGFVNVGTGNNITSTGGSATLSNNGVYIYSSDKANTITNSTNITSTGTTGKNYGIYSSSQANNSGNIDFSNGVGNLGIYMVNGGTGRNSGTITVGASDVSNELFSVGMAAGYIGDKTTAATTGAIENNGTINVNGEYSIGMYGAQSGTTVTNNKDIVLNASNTTGIYVENNAKAVNNGSIRTGASGLSNVTGVVLGPGSTLTNNGTINISGTASKGALLKGGTIANYGSITVSGAGSKETDSLNSTPTTKILGPITINAPAGASTATITANGVTVTPTVVKTAARNPITVSANSIGLYVNTSGKDYTKSITGLGNLTSEADLIIGTEASQSTTSKYIQVNDNKILDPYNNAILSSGVSKWDIYSGSLTWITTPTLDPGTGKLTNLYMAKVPYTEWAADRNTYNFADGLEQRYGVEKLGSRENQVFQKLNGIGNNEETLLFQAYDEMMGHQYANVQQRVQATGNILDKEFDYLRSKWQTASKDSNKLKTFGTRGEYKTETAGVIDYKYHAEGVAYVHENEDIKLGKGIGWYSGIVHNKIKFRDIGNSKEEQLQAKVGLYKSVPFDDNNSLNWTISGEVFAGHNKMDRRFLVVDEVFHAKSRYYNYGVGIKNEVGKEFRLSESFSLRPYAALGLEYGRISKIREKSGEIKLDVKQNDYISVKPEVGAELAFKHYFGTKSIRVGLGAAYENELGKVANGKNKARVANTNADWFNIRGEKEDRRGNVKFDLNLGLDNQRFGVTGNVGYDTKGQNVRGGLGLRVIF